MKLIHTAEAPWSERVQEQVELRDVYETGTPSGDLELCCGITRCVNIKW